MLFKLTNILGTEYIINKVNVANEGLGGSTQTVDARSVTEA